MNENSVHRVYFAEDEARDADYVSLKGNGWVSIRWEPYEVGEEQTTEWDKFAPGQVERIRTWIGPDAEEKRERTGTREEMKEIRL